MSGGGCWIDNLTNYCQSQLPIVRVIPKLFLQKGFSKALTKQAYYFTNKLCFTCPAKSKYSAMQKLGPCYEEEDQEEIHF